MTPREFDVSLNHDHPPEGLSLALEALWWAGRDDWKRAHRCIMDDDASDSAWVHAYLHRQENDIENATFWYNQAHRPIPALEPNEEWQEIVEQLLAR